MRRNLVASYNKAKLILRIFVIYLYISTNKHELVVEQTEVSPRMHLEHKGFIIKHILYAYFRLGKVE